MYTDLFLALLERRNPRKHPLLSALLYEFCPQAACFWRAGLDPILPVDPVWMAMQDYASGSTLNEQLAMYELGDFSASAEQYITDIEEFRGENVVRAPENSALFTQPAPTAEDKRKFTRAVEKHFGGWENLYAYIRAWAFLLGDFRLRCGIPNDHPYLLRKNSVLLQVPDLGEPLYWQVWAWWVKVQNVTTIHLGLLTLPGQRDPFRPFLMRTCNLEGDSPWPGGDLPRLHHLNQATGEVEAPEYLWPDKQVRFLLAKLASVAEMGVYPPLNLLRQPDACRRCGFQKFCYNDDRPTDLALRGLEDVPTWQSDAR